VVFYDGVCGLCNRLVQFLLVRDRRGVLHFAPLQGELAGPELARHGVDPADLDSVGVVSDWGLAGERADTRAAAVLEALERLGGGWRLAARAGRIVPRTLADLVYRAVARSRYRIFGRLDTCPLPRPEWKDRFLR
jgi:predicted DCC family thiol-disulfide oxidoreductase YuxK